VHCRWVAARALRGELLPELAGFLARTPALPWLYRALGARIGAGALVDTAGVQDPSLFSLGAGSKLHAGVEVSPALLVPAGVFGARPALLFVRVEVGAGCEAGHRAVLPAGSRLADGQHLRPRAAPTHVGAVGKGPLADAPHFCAEERLHPALGLLAAAAAFLLHALVLFPPLLLNTTLVGLALGGDALEILAQRLDASAAEPSTTVLLWSLLFVTFMQYVTLPLAGVLHAALVVLFKRAVLGRLPPGTDLARSRWLLWRFALFARLQDDPNLAPFRGVFGSTQVAVWYLRALGAAVADSTFLGALHVAVPDALAASAMATSGGESAAYCLDAAGVVQSVRLGVGAVVGNSAVLYPGAAVGRLAVLGNDSVLPAGAELGENVRVQGRTRYVVAPDENLVGALSGGSAAAAPRLYSPHVALALWAAAPIGTLLVWLAAVPATLGVASVAGWGAVPVYIAAVGVGAVLNALWLRALPRLCGMHARWAAGEAGVFSVAAQLCHGLLSPPAFAALQGTPFLPAALRLVGFRVGRGAQLLCRAPLERTLVTLGAGSVVEGGCQVEGHYIEPLKFKYHATSIGARAWVQAGARVMPLVTFGDGARLLPASTVLPGEALLPGWVWGGGAPASPLLEPAELEGARSAKL
jgi:non-ribosomal peptide synthetase-like protein